MKRPDTFLTNTVTATGRAQGAAKNNPGDNTGSGMDKEIYNDPAYAVIAMAESYKEGGISDADETTVASDLRDALEEMTGKKVTDPVTAANSVDEWDVAEAGYTVGDAVMEYGIQYVAFYITGITGVSPSSKAGRAFWRKVPTLDKLMDLWDNGDPMDNGLNPMSDRAGAKYQQNIDFGRYRLGGNGETFKQFSLVHLDGTVVTGDATLEAIFDTAGTPYWNIDMIAPDVLGTRTLLDLGGDVARYQESSGDFATVGGKVADQSQGHRHDTLDPAGRFYTASGSVTISGAGGAPLSASEYTTGDPVTDGTNGTPRTGTRTYGPSFTKAIPAVILCNDL